MFFVFFLFSRIFYYDFKTETQSQTETSHTGWVEINDQPLFDGERQAYFLPLPVNDGANGKFLHVAKISLVVSTISRSNKYHKQVYPQYW